MSRFSATLPTPHGASSNASTRTTTTTTNFFISFSLRNLLRRSKLRVERLQAFGRADVIPAAGMQFSAERALRDRLAQQWQQWKFSGLTARKQLRPKDADA